MRSVAYNERIRFGLFDSGVGGLSVLRRLHQLATVCTNNKFEFVYLGDTSRCPYGNRQPEEIRQFVTEIVNFLDQQGVDHIVMACNTSAAVSLDHARRISPVPVHDIISPTARYAAKHFRRIGVMATQSTASSKAFSQRIHYHAPQAEVIEIGCPKLVPLVESGDLYSEHAKAVLMEYTSQLEEQGVDAIILGCTHFPFLQRAIRDLLPSTVTLLDPAEMLARQIASDLSLHVDPQSLTEPVAEIHCGHPSKIFTTGSASTFAATASVCLGRTTAALVASGGVSRVSLDDFHGIVAVSGAPVSNVVQLPTMKSVMTDPKIVKA